jgi:hypothetical protein
MPMSGLNLRLYNILATANEGTNPGASVVTTEEPIENNGEGAVSRLTTLLQEIPLRPFERDPDLDAVIRNYKQDANLDTLVSELDAFAAEHELYESITTTGPTLDAIKAEDLELVCYELFSG